MRSAVFPVTPLLRLGRYFGTTPEFWLNMQRDFEFETAQIQAGEDIIAKVRPRAA